MSSETPGPELPKEEEPPPPPPPEEPEPMPKAPDILEDENAWAEPYDEHIDAEEPPPVKPRKRKRRYGGTIVLVGIIIFLIVWTLLSPKVLPQSGDTYVNSTRYANLGGFADSVDSWAGDFTWGLSVSGSNTTTVGAQLNISILVSKVHEDPSNFWIRGAGIQLRNASVFNADGSILGEMSDKTDFGFGPLMTVPIAFPAPGDYELYAYVKFIMFADMRIGFLPLTAVEMQSALFTIHVE